MGANSISTLTYKRDRQIAKLDLAQTKRLAQNKDKPYYDIELLPTIYAEDDNETLINNANTGGLQPGRPWVAIDPKL